MKKTTSKVLLHTEMNHAEHGSAATQKLFEHPGIGGRRLMLRILSNARLLLRVKGWRAALRYISHCARKSVRVVIVVHD